MSLYLFKNVEIPKKFISSSIVFVGALTTLAVAPALTFDPINIPKMAALVLGTSVLLSYLLFNWRLLLTSPRVLRYCLFIFVFGIVLNLLFAPSRFGLKFYGEWGRSTGALTYFAFVILMLAASTQLHQSRMTIVRNFIRLSYLISGYTIIQYLELDPINWNSKEPFATLGNINFMSAFLGLATVIMLNYVFSNHPNITERLHFGLWAIVNSMIIFSSGSIQGIAMILSGISALSVLWLFENGKRVLSILLSILLLILGLIMFLGTLGFGPLGKLLLQPSVLFRLDYWKAGIAIFSNFPILGTGMDSYGDFYREFRDSIAVERTGPQRVTNTAHNIFLDLLSGGGIFVGGSFLILFFFVVVQVYKLKTDTERFKFEKRIYASTLISLAVFYNISIHQIGVGVWGFILLGLGMGLTSEVRNPRFDGVRSSPTSDQKHLNAHKFVGKKKKAKEGKIVEAFESPVKMNIVVTLIFFSLSFVILYPPVEANRLMLSALKENRIDLLQKSTQGVSGTTYSEDRYLDLLLDSNREKEAVAAAMEIIKTNPRQYFAWTVLALASNSSQEEREQAASMLQRLDPKNTSLRVDIEKAWREITNR